MAMRRNILITVFVALLAGAAIYQLRKKESIDFGSFHDFNVLFVTIDTLRADHLPAYGYTHIRTPNLDKLAYESLIFEDAISQAPMTLPAHVSLLTGLLPQTHGVRDNFGFILDSHATTLAEILKNNGYQTAAFISAFVLDSQFGIDQGFDLYSDSFTLAQARITNTDVHRIAEETQMEVNAWLQKNHQKKFFMWVHYYDPHDPYQPPEPFKTEYKSASYDGEIAYTDHVLGNFVKVLEQLELKKKTIIVITGDHGEGLGEHKEQTHSLFIYNATQHVPLFIRLPNIEGRRVEGVVSHVDIAPTVLDWLGIRSNALMQGKSLIPLIQKKEKSERSAYSESISAEVHYGWSALKGVTTSQYKFIDAPTPELYDRQTDRKETRNLIREKPEIAKEMHRGLQTFLHSAPKYTFAKKQTPDLETKEKLRSLGYIGTAAGSTGESRKIDPKDRIDLLEMMTRAHKASDRKNYPLVVQITRQILEQDPNIVEAHFLLATAYLHLLEKQKALDAMMKTVRLKPDHTQTLYNLGFFYQLEGNNKEAEDWYLQLLKYEPSHLRGMLNLINLYRSMNQPENARPYLSQILDSYKDAIQTTTSPEVQSGLLEKLGEVHLLTGDLKSAEEMTRKALQFTPEGRGLHFQLGAIYETQKELQNAAAEYLEETKLDSSNAAAFFNLGRVYRQLNRLEDAIHCFKQAIKMNPHYFVASYHLAEAYLAEKRSPEEILRLIAEANAGIPSDRRERLLIDIRKRLKSKE